MYVYVYVHTRIYACIYIYACMNVRMYELVRVCVFVCVCIGMIKFNGWTVDGRIPAHQKGRPERRQKVKGDVERNARW